jgi:hypothetical protein
VLFEFGNLPGRFLLGCRNADEDYYGDFGIVHVPFTVEHVFLITCSTGKGWPDYSPVLLRGAHLRRYADPRKSSQKRRLATNEKELDADRSIIASGAFAADRHARLRDVSRNKTGLMNQCRKSPIGQKYGRRVQKGPWRLTAPTESSAETRPSAHDEKP